MVHTMLYNLFRDWRVDCGPRLRIGLFFQLGFEYSKWTKLREKVWFHILSLYYSSHVLPNKSVGRMIDEVCSWNTWSSPA